jgi:hypothetical protein
MKQFQILFMLFCSQSHSYVLSLFIFHLSSLLFFDFRLSFSLLHSPYSILPSPVSKSLFPLKVFFLPSPVSVSPSPGEATPWEFSCLLTPFSGLLAKPSLWEVFQLPALRPPRSALCVFFFPRPPDSGLYKKLRD